EEPRFAADGENHAENRLSRRSGVGADQFDELAGRIADGEFLQLLIEIGLLRRGELDLPAPAVDVVEHVPRATGEIDGGDLDFASFVVHFKRRLAKTACLPRD